MTNIGLPVPPGFTITTETCNEYTKLGKLPDGLWEDVLAALADVEKDMGKKLGDAANPLLVSVRSGAKFSMPGMMDTVLNLGLNDEHPPGHRRRHRQRALRLRRLSPLPDDVLGHRPFRASIPSSRSTTSSTSSTPSRRSWARRSIPKSTPPACKDLCRPVQGLLQGSHRQRLPHRPDGAAQARHHRRLQELEQRARGHLPQPREDRPRPRHRRQHPDDGLRQHGRRLRHRRRVHPQRRDRRQQALRRVPQERAGRGRGRRRAHS